VYAWCMTRTNIEIDDDLIARAMTKYGLRTKRSAVELALQRLVGPPLTGEALLDYVFEIEGTGWDLPEGALDEPVETA
jgi:Arc/MetJ family transcription regulator